MKLWKCPLRLNIVHCFIPALVRHKEDNFFPRIKSLLSAPVDKHSLTETFDATDNLVAVDAKNTRRNVLQRNYYQLSPTFINTDNLVGHVNSAFTLGHMSSDMSSDKSLSVNGSIEKQVHILGTHVAPHVERRVCTCFSMKPFTPNDLSLDISLDMCPSVKAL